MKVTAIKTRILQPPEDDLLEVISSSVSSLKEKSVFVITSKVVSIWQGRCVPVTSIAKDELIMQEADIYLPRDLVSGAWCMHTVKNDVFIPSAGIDESNAASHYILWPREIEKTAKKLWLWIRKRYNVKDLGVIITDSHTIPLRRGMMGISVAHYGFLPLKDYRGKPDLFGRAFKMTQTNIADGLSAAAVTLMGEGSECTPICIIEDVPWIQFVSKPKISKKPFSSFTIKTQEDLYFPLFSAMPWKEGKGGKK